MQIPDWAWKFISVLVIPILVWAIATHVAVGQHDMRLLKIEQSQEKDTEKFDEQNQVVHQVQKELAVMNTKMEYVSRSMDEIKEILKDERK